MLQAENALRKELRPYGNTNVSQNRTMLLFPCTSCDKEMWIENDRRVLARRTGECRDCRGKRAFAMHPAFEKARNRKRPYEWLFNALVSTAKERYGVTITYEDFLEFTKIRECHYCGSEIVWHPYTPQDKAGSHGWHLDRKDNTKGYENGNLVVACIICNRIKNSHLSYEEMLLLSPGLRQVMKARRIL